MILMFCQPSNPRSLFDEFWDTWTDDLVNQGRRSGMELTDSQKKTMLLLDLDHRLQSFEMNLSHFDLPVPTEDDMAQVFIIQVSC